MRRYGFMSAIIAVTIALDFTVASTQERQIGGVGLTIFAERDFRGRSATIRQDTSDFRRIGMNDVAWSLQVGPGEQWEVCEHASFRGRCAVFSGSESDLGLTAWEARISSARRIRGGVGIVPPIAPAPGGLELFAGTGFTGDRRAFTGPHPDLRRVNFNDAAQSLRIGRGEVWQICVDSNYRNCMTVNTDWQDLRGINMFRRISSVRPWGQASGGGNQNFIVLFDDRQFRGRSFRVERETGLLSFNNRAESVQVIGGPWELCDGASFTGRCAVISNHISDLSTVGLRNLVSSARPVRQPR